MPDDNSKIQGSSVWRRISTQDPLPPERWSLERTPLVDKDEPPIVTPTTDGGFDKTAFTPSSGFAFSMGTEKKQVDRTPAPPPRLLGDLPAGTPIALTDRAKASGIVPPREPHIFPGAQVKDARGSTEGTLVGYTSNGSFLVRDHKGDDHRVSELAVKPGQQFQSVAQTLPPSQVHKVSPQMKQALDALADKSFGWGRGSTAGEAIEAIRDAGFEAFVAGGAVRDALQGKEPRDVDLATTMWIREADRAMSKAGISTGMVRSEFGTMLCGRGSTGLDVCSLKSARGEFGLDLKADIKYRDFTINCLFYDKSNGTVLDPTGNGVADAQAKKLRPSCPPGQEAQWLRDNPSVVLRFLKFTLRGYTFDPSLLKMMKDNFSSCVRGMDGLRRSRQLDSVYEGGGQREKITDELKRLGFPQSDIDALFGSRSWFGGFGSSKDDDDDGPRRVGGGWLSKMSQDSQASASDVSSTPASAGRYIAPSIGAVKEYAQKTGKTVEDFDTRRYSSTAAARLGTLPNREGDSFSKLYGGGFKKKEPGLWTHADGSWAHFVQGNAFRGVGNKVFAGRAPSTESTTSTPPVTVSPSQGAPPPPAGDALARLQASVPGLKRTQPSYSEHGRLAVVPGHLGRLRLMETEAAADLKRAGFHQTKPGLWEHKDQSWVRFYDGVFRGYQDQVFTTMPFGPGPQKGSDE